LVGRTLSGLQKRQQLAKDLRRIAAVDLLDDDDEFRSGILGRGLYRLHEDSVDERQFSLAGRPPTPHEVLIGQIGMKLNRTNLALILLAHEGKAQPLRQPCLARSWRPLKDHVLLDAQSV